MSYPLSPTDTSDREDRIVAFLAETDEQPIARLAQRVKWAFTHPHALNLMACAETNS